MEKIKKVRESAGTGMMGAKNILLKEHKKECKKELKRFISEANTVDELKEAMLFILDEVIE